jgi:hypothetical protein
VKKAKIRHRAKTVLAAIAVSAARLTAPALAAAAVVLLIIVVALCWIVSDDGRSERLALLIDAGRGRVSQRTSAAALPAQREETKNAAR